MSQELIASFPSTLYSYQSSTHKLLLTRQVIQIGTQQILKVNYPLLSLLQLFKSFLVYLESLRILPCPWKLLSRKLRRIQTHV